MTGWSRADESIVNIRDSCDAVCKRIHYCSYRQSADLFNTIHAKCVNKKDSTLEKVSKDSVLAWLSWDDCGPTPAWRSSPAAYRAFWDTLFPDTFSYTIRAENDGLDTAKRALSFTGTRCFWRVSGTDLDTVKAFVRVHDHVLGMARSKDPDHPLHLDNWARASGLDYSENDTLSGIFSQRSWLAERSDHATTYFHGLEVNLHAYREERKDARMTCLVQQVQLVRLAP